MLLPLGWTFIHGRIDFNGLVNQVVHNTTHLGVALSNVKEVRITSS